MRETTEVAIPWGVKEDRIHEFAKILAVADAFDAITSERIYENRFSPFYALKEIRDEAFENSLDPRIALVFFDKLMSYFVGSKVVLSNGDKGEIIYFNKKDLYNPVIKVNGEIIDLSKEDDITLEDVLVF